MRPVVRDLTLRSLLALDLARTTGWAFGGFADIRPQTGVWKLPDGPKDNPLGARVAALENTLSAALDRWQPSIIMLAVAFRSRNMAEAMHKSAYYGIAYSEAWRRDIKILEQAEGTVRKEVLGHGTAPSGDMKEMVMRWCASQGIDALDHNAADAAVCWRWTRDELIRQRM